MKTLYRVWKRLTDKNFKTKVANATRLWANIDASTIGRTSHFYNTTGDKIRGWHGRKYNFPSLAATESHPLIQKYR